MLAIGTMAALRGLGAALSLCLGLALGAGTLAAVLFSLVLAQAAADASVLNSWGRVAGALCQIMVAVLILRMRPLPAGAGTAPRASGFLAGFCTAATNPLTAAYFIAQFLGPLAGATADRVVLATAGLAFGFFVLVAAVLSLPAARRLALAWNRPIRWGAAAALSATALATLASAAEF
jgi:hypothetical protein